MKRYIVKIAWLLALLPLLPSCSNEEELIQPNPPVVNEGEAMLQVKIEFPRAKSATYAEATFGATAEEKEIRSIAFFTKNEDEGAPGPDFKEGAFNRFLSTEEPRTSTGLYEPLSGDNGAYTATVKLRSDGFGGNKVKVLVIANYEENGLTQALKDVPSWDALTTLTTQPLSNNPVTPLLMVAVDENVPLTNGGMVNVTFNMDRLVSRIDIENLASANGFELTSARLVNPRSYSYAVPSSPNADNIAVAAADFDPLLPTQSDPAKITGMYTYESSNSSALTATAVLIKGIYNNIQFEKRIPLKQPDKDGITGDPIPLKRNYRYLIKLSPSTDPTEVEWTIKVADWDDGDEVEVNPPESVIPQLSDFAFEDNPNADDWNPDALVYNIENHLGKQVSFTVKNVNTTKYTISYRCLEKHVAAFGLHDKNSGAYKSFVKRGEPVITYAQVEQLYTVNIPQLVYEPTAPIAIVLSIENAHNRNVKKEVVFIYNKTSYPGTNLPPVSLGGRYWAPVNVGATTDNPTAFDVAGMGYVYQWGRNEYPSDPYLSGIVNPGEVSTTDFIALDPTFTFEDATTGKYKDKFIGVVDWINETDPMKEVRDKRWIPEVNDSPCPDGWRVPTFDELLLIVSHYTNSAPLEEDKRMGVKADEPNTYLYLPKSNCRNPRAGAIESVNDVTFNRSLYWSSRRGGVASAYYMDNNAKTAGMNGALCAYGFTIRCIQQDVEDGRS